jgi:hypothetical protein
MPQSLDIEVFDVPMRVYFEYEPAQPMVWSGPQAGPAYDSQAIIDAVLIGGVDVYEMLTNKQLDRIEKVILRILED